MDDHVQFDKRRELKDDKLMTATGRVFRSVDSKLLDPEIRRGIVRMRLESSKKAGTQSNQRASAATTWLVANARHNFAEIETAWAGLHQPLNHNPKPYNKKKGNGTTCVYFGSVLLGPVATPVKTSSTPSLHPGPWYLGPASCLHVQTAGASLTP